MTRRSSFRALVPAAALWAAAALAWHCGAPTSEEASTPHAGRVRPVARPALERMDPELAERFESALKRTRRAPDDAGAWLQLGRLAYVHRFRETAEAALDNAQVLDPRNFEAAYLLGVVRFESGAWGPASHALQRALELDPSYDPARLRLGEVLLKAGDPSAARPWFEAVLERPGFRAAALWGLARCDLDEGNLREAAERIRKALALDPGADRLYYVLGQALRRAGDLSGAQAALARAGRREPDFPDPVLAALRQEATGVGPLLKVAYHALQQGDVDRAVETYRQAAALEPDNPEIYQALGLALWRARRPDEARDAYRRALELRPEDPSHAYALGFLLVREGRAEEGLRYLEKALERDPEFLEAQAERGVALERLGRVEEAEAAYREVLERDAANRQSLLGLARVLRRTGRDEQALQVLETLSNASPGDAEAALSLGSLLQDLGRTREAEAAYRRAARAVDAPDGVRASAWHNLGGLWRQLGRLEEAERAFREALRLDPASRDSRFALGAVLGQRARYDASAAQFQTILADHPDDTEAALAAATALHLAGRSEEGAEVLAEALEQSPGHPWVLLALAKIRLAQGRAGEAGSLARASFEAAPSVGAAEVVWQALQLAGKEDEGEAWRREALEEARRMGHSELVRALQKLR